ncbi:MAG: efflux RND transporter periplasmic adaptor subunit, partial [Phycisphaerae bacterium]
RSRELLAGKLASQEEYDTAATTAATALADLKNAEAQIADLKTSELALGLKEQAINMQQANLTQNQVNWQIQKLQLEYATVYSPLDGVVSSLTSGKDASGNSTTTRIGSIVQSGTSNVSGGTTVMTISDLSHVFIYATVDESDIGQVVDPQRNPDKPHQLVRITADAYPGREFEGEVVRVATKGVNSNNVVTFEVRIEVTSRNRRLLKPEMTANVEIIVAERAEVLTVPVLGIVRQRRQADTKLGSQPATTTAASATQQYGPGGMNSGPIAATATVLKADGSNETRNVTLGITDGYIYEVLTGLNEGENVVLDKFGSDSKWRPGGNRPLGMPAGGGRGR